MFTLPTFTPGDIDGNSKKIIGYFGLDKPEDVGAKRVTVLNSDGVSGVSFYVDEETLQTSLFLFYLYTMGRFLGDDLKFKMDSDLRNLVLAYYGQEICKHALSDVCTQHFIVKALLKEGSYVFLEVANSRRSIEEMVDSAAPFENVAPKFGSNEWSWVFPRSSVME